MKRDRTQPCDQIGQLERRAGENEGDQSRTLTSEWFFLCPEASFKIGDHPRHLHRPNALPIVGAYGLGSGIVG